MFVKLNPDLYGPYVVYEKNRKVLYVQVIRAKSTECWAFTGNTIGGQLETAR
jgi:hypothetical protein